MRHKCGAYMKGKIDSSDFTMIADMVRPIQNYER